PNGTEYEPRALSRSITPRPSDEVSMLRNGPVRRHSPRRAANRYLAIATDRDGTLNRYDWVGRQTLAALERWRQSGHKLILVTGETADDLKEFPHLGLFDAVVAENGAALYEPRSGRFRPLASR